MNESGGKKISNINMSNKNKYMHVRGSNRQEFKPVNVSNSKRILCFNMLNNNKCDYGNKCMYAHSLNEQKIDPIRHKVYMLIKKNDWSDIEIVNDKKLYEALLSITKTCTLCAKGSCTGGYNCRHGAISDKYRICYEDFMNGNCNRQKCPSIHLTEKKLRPYNIQRSQHIAKKNKILKTNAWISGQSSAQKDSGRKKQKIVYKDKESVTSQRQLNDILSGVLLTKDFILSRFNRLTRTSQDDIESETSEEDIERIIEYLNAESSDDDRTIFDVDN